MKAVRFHGVGRLEVDDLPVPSAGDCEVLIKVGAVGVCGTDTHILDGHYPSVPPVTLGHEVAGTIADLGRNVNGFQVGDLVTVEPHRYCGLCSYCRRGMEHMCLNKEAYGVHLDGGMAEFLAVPARVVYRLPDGVDVVRGALAEPLSCCVHAIDRLELKSGLPLYVGGCGPAGSMLIALAAKSGMAPIVAADTREDRRSLALRMGAHVALDPSAGDVVQQALAATGGEGFPFLVDAVGHPGVLHDCIKMSARGGRILVFGVADPAAEAIVYPNDIYSRELTILGSAINPFTALRAVGLLTQLPLDQLQIESFALEDAAAAIEAVRSGRYDKVQLVPSGKDVP
jgi:threonine dehydrogenase-like Zn-dependent dehydrogenase